MFFYFKIKNNMQKIARTRKFSTKFDPNNELINISMF